MIDRELSDQVVGDALAGLDAEERMSLSAAALAVGELLAANDHLRGSVMKLLMFEQKSWLEKLNRTPDFGRDPLAEKREEDHFKSVAAGIAAARERITSADALRTLSERLTQRSEP